METQNRGASEGQLVFVHVGKCGGTSVKQALRAAGVEFDEVHIRPVEERGDARYVILLRDPITRAVSAFNWRFKLVVSARRSVISLPWIRWNWRWQRFRFDKEYEILKRYGDLNTLAEALYDGDTPNEEAGKDFRRIHHLKESIAFYFQDFDILKMRNQIEAVLFQESLGDDFREVFGLAHPLGNFLRNKSTKSALSPTAKGHLARFLEEDYRVIRELHAIGKIPEERFQAILAGAE